MRKWSFFSLRSRSICVSVRRNLFYSAQFRCCVYTAPTVQCLWLGICCCSPFLRFPSHVLVTRIEMCVQYRWAQYSVFTLWLWASQRLIVCVLVFFFVCLMFLRFYNITTVSRKKYTYLVHKTCTESGQVLSLGRLVLWLAAVASSRSLFAQLHSNGPQMRVGFLEELPIPESTACWLPKGIIRWYRLHHRSIAEFYPIILRFCNPLCL